MITNSILFIGCFSDCWYENDKSECTITGFEKPKDGHCGGKFRCIMCDLNPIDRTEFDKGGEVCQDCLKLIEAYKKGFH